MFIANRAHPQQRPTQADKADAETVSFRLNELWARPSTLVHDFPPTYYRSAVESTAGAVMSYLQRGFSLVAALFLIVVVAVLGVFAVRIGAGQQQTVNLALLSARALAAANSGIEAGANSALVACSCGSQTINLTEAGLAGFTVAVTCSGTKHTELTRQVNVYEIEALAQQGTYGTPDYVSRRVRATFTDADSVTVCP